MGIRETSMKRNHSDRILKKKFLLGCGNFSLDASRGERASGTGRD